MILAWFVKNYIISVRQDWTCLCLVLVTLLWRHNGCDSVSNHQTHDYLLNRLFGCTSKKTSTLRVTGLCVGNSPGTGQYPAQMASNVENVSIWWHHHDDTILMFIGLWLTWHCGLQYNKRKQNCQTTSGSCGWLIWTRILIAWQNNSFCSVIFISSSFTFLLHWIFFFGSMWPSNVIWRPWCMPAGGQVMAWFLTAPIHHRSHVHFR